MVVVACLVLLKHAFLCAFFFFFTKTRFVCFFSFAFFLFVFRKALQPRSAELLDRKKANQDNAIQSTIHYILVEKISRLLLTVVNHCFYCPVERQVCLTTQ